MSITICQSCKRTVAAGIYCENCGRPLDSSRTTLERTYPQLPGSTHNIGFQPQSAQPPRVTILPNGEISVTANSVTEAKLALKELKLKKKEISLAKRQVVEQQKQIRAAYTDRVRRQGSKVQGGGKVGSIVRSIQTSNRDMARRELANKLAPLDQRKSHFEAQIAAIDQLVIQVESYIINNS